MVPASKWLAMPSIRVFDEVNCSKGQAMKVLEEASEVHAAWRDYERTRSWGEDCDACVANNDALISLVDGCCDVIQATCNLLASIGVTDLTGAMLACRRRNIERGLITR